MYNTLHLHRSGAAVKRLPSFLFWTFYAWLDKKLYILFGRGHWLCYFHLVRFRLNAVGHIAFDNPSTPFCLRVTMIKIKPNEKSIMIFFGGRRAAVSRWPQGGFSWVWTLFRFHGFVFRKPIFLNQSPPQNANLFTWAFWCLFQQNICHARLQKLPK